MRRFTAAELRDYLQSADPAPLLLDVREPWEFDTCRIDGAKLLPMRQIPSALADLDPQREMVVICHHGIRSLAVARFLEQAGFENLINLEGGVDAWAKEVDPAMKTY